MVGRLAGWVDWSVFGPVEEGGGRRGEEGGGRGPLLTCVSRGPGVLRTAVADMDRETQEEYLVVLEAKDMGGHLGGLSGTTTVTVTLADVNDNPPHFRRSKSSRDLSRPSGIRSSDHQIIIRSSSDHLSDHHHINRSSDHHHIIRSMGSEPSLWDQIIRSSDHQIRSSSDNLSDHHHIN